MHIIAAKAVALGIASTEPFRARQRQTIANAQALCRGAASRAASSVLTGGTDVHLVLVDLEPTGLDGKTAESRLEEVGITVNRNAIPFDERPPMNPSGLRIGTPALTTRGLVEDDLREIAQVICVALSDRFEAERDALRERTARADGALSALSRSFQTAQRPSELLHHPGPEARVVERRRAGARVAVRSGTCTCQGSPARTRGSRRGPG